MSDAPLTPHQEDQALAGEYVVGLLALPDRIAAEARIKADPAFADLVANWETRLEDLNDDYDEVQPPNLLPAIEARLFPQAAAVRKSWFTGLMGLGLGTVAALGLAAFLLLSPPSPTMTATLTADASPLRYEAAIAGTELTITRVAGDAANANQVHQLWLIAGDNAPVSLGLITGNTLTIAAPAAAAGFVLAISLEPAGGSTTGAPTGPVLVVGKLAKI